MYSLIHTEKGNVESDLEWKEKSRHKIKYVIVFENYYWLNKYQLSNVTNNQVTQLFNKHIYRFLRIKKVTHEKSVPIKKIRRYKNKLLINVSNVRCTYASVSCLVMC